MSGARNRRVGAVAENRVEAHKQGQGFMVIHTKTGPIDILAWKPDVIQAIQVKATKTPFSGFPPHERKLFLLFAQTLGAMPLLYWWPPDRQRPKIFPANTWPPC